MPKKPRKISDLARGIERHRRTTWVDALKPKDRQELEQLRSDWLSGALSTAGWRPSLRQLHLLILKEIPGLRLCLTTFQSWIMEKAAHPDDK